MEIHEWINLSTWFMPIVFMILYHIKTDRLDFLTYPTIFIPITIASLGTAITYPKPFIFYPDVLIAYSIMMGLGMYLLKIQKKLSYLQALSLTFITSFIVSFFWEIPIFVYTILHRGGIDKAMPLHILSAFPAFFIDQKIKKHDKRKTRVFLALGIAVSSIFLAVLIGAGIFPANLDMAHESVPSWVKLLWGFNRLASFLPLIYIVYRSELR